MKRHKSSGPDALPAELFIASGDILVTELVSLFGKVWEEVKVPPDWGESVIVPIFKKGPRNDCANHRGISLISVIARLLVSILLRRLSPFREAQISEFQAGFRPGRGCIDQIFALRQLLEHRHTYRRPTIVVFLDIRAAFDSVCRTMLWSCLIKKGVPPKYVSLLQELYRHTTGRVRAYGVLSQSFKVTSGVRQGCPISPFLFNFAVEDILENALNDIHDCGLELLPGNRVKHLDYADDIALLGDDPIALQRVLDKLVIEASKYGLVFAPSKCKVLLQDWIGPAPTLQVDGLVLDSVDSFTYLGSRITSGSDIRGEVDARIAKARYAFSNLRHLWRRRDISYQLKGRVYAASVRAVLLYGCETWPLRAEDIRRLSVFDQRCLRSIARVWWQHHVSNEVVRGKVSGECGRSLHDIVLQHRLRWLGHVLRMPPHRLPRRALFALPSPNWKKPRGGQAMTWRREVKRLTSSLASAGSVRLPGWGPKDGECKWLETLEVMAWDRNQWRECCKTCLLPSPHL